jgi:CRP/FNR family cyclic AMP-dependent transcriptional regulator
MDVIDWPARTLMGRLDPTARAGLLRAGVARRYEPGDVLIHEGLLESHVFLLEDALVKITVLLPAGRQALMAIRVSGDLVGEMSALNAVPRSATVTACRPSAVRQIGHDAFRSFLRQHADAAIEVAGIVADRLRAANRRRADFASYPVKVRVARALAEMGAWYGRRVPAGIAVDVELTQSELATLCGAADITVHKVLRDLREAGLIATEYRGFVIRDIEDLRALAQMAADAPP